MSDMTIARVVLCLLFTLGVHEASPSAQAPPAAQAPSQTMTGLSPGAQEVARIIGVQDLVDRYLQLPVADRAFGAGMSRDAMLLRMELTDAVLGASLDADGVMAELD